MKLQIRQVQRKCLELLQRLHLKRNLAGDTWIEERCHLGKILSIKKKKKIQPVKIDSLERTQADNDGEGLLCADSEQMCVIATAFSLMVQEKIVLCGMFF